MSSLSTAIKDVFEDTRVIAEPAEALSLAGLKSYVAKDPNRTVSLVAITSDMNFDRLRHVAERAKIGAAREILLGVTIPERRDSYRSFIKMLGGRVFTEFNYRYGGANDTHVLVGLKLDDAHREKAGIIDEFLRSRYEVLDMSADETVARAIHGGWARGTLQDKVLLRFEFPERPGALLRFLDEVGDTWNITLFHYRNHGADCGRVLAGLQVPPDDRQRLFERLDSLGYFYEDETSNPGYRPFLS